MAKKKLKYTLSINYNPKYYPSFENILRTIIGKKKADKKEFMEVIDFMGVNKKIRYLEFDFKTRQQAQIALYTVNGYDRMQWPKFKRLDLKHSVDEVDVS